MNVAQNHTIWLSEWKMYGFMRGNRSVRLVVLPGNWIILWAIILWATSLPDYTVPTSLPAIIFQATNKRKRTRYLMRGRGQHNFVVRLSSRDVELIDLCIAYLYEFLYFMHTVPIYRHCCFICITGSVSYLDSVALCNIYRDVCVCVRVEIPTKRISVMRCVCLQDCWCWHVVIVSIHEHGQCASSTVICIIQSSTA